MLVVNYAIFLKYYSLSILTTHGTLFVHTNNTVL